MKLKLTMSTPWRGAGKLLTPHTVRMHGSLNVQGSDVEVTLTKAHLICSKTDISVIGSANYLIVTQEKGTILMPIQRMSEQVDMPEEQFKVGQTQPNIEGVLLTY